MSSVYFSDPEWNSHLVSIDNILSLFVRVRAWVRGAFSYHTGRIVERPKILKNWKIVKRIYAVTSLILRASTKSQKSHSLLPLYANIRRGQKDEFGTWFGTWFGKLLPELVLLTASNIREYIYTKIRFSAPTLSALLPMAGQICLT
jgi:hypothetical protein